MIETTLTRRQFAKFIVMSGIGLTFAACGRDAAAGRPLSPQWWVELHADGRIRLLTVKVEIGQGAHTGLRTLLAEELNVAPSSIEVVQVPSDVKYGEIITGGSFTVAGWHERIRRAGATARHMLVHAAAESWRVPADQVTTLEGYAEHAASRRKMHYRDLVAAAASIDPPSPERVQLKPPGAWRYVGKRGSIAYHNEMVTGAMRYGSDIRLPGMCFAVLARAPALGARPTRIDDSAARVVPGFIRTVALPGNAWPSLDHCREAVAVVAQNSWAAQRARDALQIQWSAGSSPPYGTSEIFDVLAEHAARPGTLSLQRGDVAVAAASRCVSAQYRMQYLAHAPLEPPNATARMQDGRIEVWCGTQRQTRLKDAIVRLLGMQPENVSVYAERSGGSFGRRLEVDYGVEAASLALSLNRPVQVLWTRSDDLRFGLCRSGSVHHLSASLDASGRWLGFEHRYAAESVLLQQQPHQVGEIHGDASMAAPLVSLLYEVPNVRLEHHAVKPLTPCSWWRGTYWNNVTSAVECFVDELAERSRQDPLAFRLAHLASDQRREFVVGDNLRIPFEPARMRAVLQAAADAVQWQEPPPVGHARGLACGIYDSPECHAAVIAEMLLQDGVPVLSRAVIAVDVGTVINPEVVRSQCLGGFLMGASAALREQITWRDGQVEQHGFEDYSILRMSGCPRIEIVIVPSGAGICGVGEIVTPAAIAAVSNAASRLLGRRVRSWPVS